MPRKKKEKSESKLKRFIQERFVTDPEALVRLGVWGLGTIAVHNLNLGGLVTYFGKSNETIETGLPYPFGRRIRFPWEQDEKPHLEDKITEWAIPALTSWILVYHPEAVAKFVDAMIPF